jgi:hypothetical protein
MPEYHITNYSYKQAKKLGVTIRPSTNKTKKIDVFKNNVKIASIGANNMNDFPTYIKKCGIKYAKTRRRLYRIRHRHDLSKKNTPGYYANKILW